MEANIEKYLNVEEEFFDIDKENRTCNMKLEFDSPDDIFDKNSITKTPMFSDDFSEWLQVAFEYTPRKYNLNLDVTFADMKGYGDSELKGIFMKNIALDFRRIERKSFSKNLVAFSLIGLGLIFFVAMLLISNLWENGGIAKDIFVYISDIATTVTFWEALTILVVENKERRSAMINIAKRFKSIEFHVK